MRRTYPLGGHPEAPPTQDHWGGLFHARRVQTSIGQDQETGREMTERTLDEQFAALPDQIKGHLFAVLDHAIGASQDEKRLAEQLLHMMSRTPTPVPIPALMGALSGLVMWARIEAEPKGGAA